MTDRLELEDDQPVEDTVNPVSLPAPVTITDMYLAAIYLQLVNLDIEIVANRTATERLGNLLEQALRKPGK